LIRFRIKVLLFFLSGRVWFVKDTRWG